MVHIFTLKISTKTSRTSDDRSLLSLLLTLCLRYENIPKKHFESKNCIFRGLKHLSWLKDLMKRQMLTDCFLEGGYRFLS